MGVLADALVSKGYNRTDAENAERGPRAAELAREYLGTSGGGGGGGGAPSPQDYAQAIIDAQKQQIQKETSFLDQYTKTNPFVFDEELARKSATAEYEPYYSELLQDYLSTVNLKRQNIQDETTLLNTMRNLDSNKRTREYTMAVDSAEKGYAGKGMFFSGIKSRGTGLLGVEYNAGQQGATAQYNTQSANLGRQTTALNLDESMKKRDVGREQQEQIEGGILTRKKEAMANYYVPLEQAYYRQFPSGSGGTLKGYTVPEYYRA